MSKPPNKCIFCERTGDMTRQHVFPDRLRHVLPRINGERLNLRLHRHTRNGETELAKDEKKSQGTTGTFRIRRVCGACNSGWMKGLEEDAFPIAQRLILGETPSLEEADQLRLMWLSMNIALVGEYLNPSAMSTLQSERSHFYRSRQPPPKWFAFMGRENTGATQPGFFTDGCATLSEEYVDSPRFYASFTMTMGRLLLHVLAMGEDFNVRPVDYAGILGIAPIWPTCRRIDVALMPQLGHDEIVRLRRFAGVAVRPHLG